MSNIASELQIKIPHEVNFVSEGRGDPVVLIHGLAASLHDWDALLPELSKAGYTGYALDLLGHGDSPKPNVREYRVDQLFEHFLFWLESLHIKQPLVLIGHSLGGYLALEFARQFPNHTRGLVLVDPVYSMRQFPALLSFLYRQTNWSSLIVQKTPEWLLRMAIDISSLSLGHSVGGLYGLPREIREQTVVDYTRTAPGVYNILNKKLELTADLSSIKAPTLVIWGKMIERFCQYRSKNL